MIVWVNGKIYNSEETNIGVFLTPGDKKNILKMAEECDTYIQGDTDQITEEIADEIANTLKLAAAEHKETGEVEKIEESHEYESLEDC